MRTRLVLRAWILAASASLLAVPAAPAQDAALWCGYDEELFGPWSTCVGVGGGEVEVWTDDPQGGGEMGADSHARNCNESTAWGVTVGYRRGSGRVQAWVQCGSTVIASCVAEPARNPCDSGLRRSTPGRLGCYYRILSGNPQAIYGHCYDPVYPDVSHVGVPVGTTFDPDVHTFVLQPGGTHWAPAAVRLP